MDRCVVCNGKLVGQKPPLKPKDVWAIRIYLQNAHAVRDLALFNLAIGSKLRGCDLVNLHVRDVTHGNEILPRAMIMQRKTKRPVQFEVTEPARVAVAAWIEKAKLRSDEYLSRAGFRGRRIFRRDNMLGRSNNGSPRSASIRPLTARTRCVGRRQH
jgi:integrase